MIIDGMSWHQFSNLPHIASLPLNRQLIEYEIYNQNLIHEVMMIQQQQQLLYPNTPSAAGAGGRVEVIDPLPSNCIQFVVDTADFDGFELDIEVSNDTDYTVNWGDGTTSNGTLTTGLNDVDYTYPVHGAGITYTVRLCFTNPENVTELDFIGDD